MPSLPKPHHGAKSASKPRPAHKTAPKAKIVETAPAKPSVPHPLPSAALDGKHLIEIGARTSTDRLLTFTQTVLVKVASHAAFAGVGLDAAWATAMNAAMAKLRTDEAALVDAKQSDLPDAEALHAAFDAGKAWRSRAATIVSMTPAIAHELHGVRTGNSVPRLAGSIRALLPLAGHKQAIASGGGAALRKEGESVLATLTLARDTHLQGIASLSPQSRAVQIDKGVLSEELKRVARAARLLIPAEASLFSLRHLRAPEKHKKPAAATPPAAPKT